MSEKILAQPPGDDCFRGMIHEGEPKGVVEKIGDIDTYISRAGGEKGENGLEKPKAILLFYADVFGPLHINNKLLQDYFASQGFLVLGIDYFLGDPVYIHDEPSFDRPAWFTKSVAQARETEPKWFEAVKARFGSEVKYVAAGYCFGAPFVLEAGATGKIVAGSVAHPAVLNEKHFTDIKVPLLLSCAEIDHTFGLEFRRRAEDILIEGKKQYFFQVFSSVKHGFATRGDPNVGDERFAKEESARGISSWFDRFTA